MQFRFPAETEKKLLWLYIVNLKFNFVSSYFTDSIDFCRSCWFCKHEIVFIMAMGLKEVCAWLNSLCSCMQRLFSALRLSPLFKWAANIMKGTPDNLVLKSAQSCLDWWWSMLTLLVSKYITFTTLKILGNIKIRNTITIKKYH